MPPIIILPLALLQGTAPPVLTVSPPPAPPVIYRAPAPPPAPPAPSTGARGPSPRGNPASWATSADYPSRMLRMEVEGKTAFRVIVNDSGRVSHCEITESSGIAASKCQSDVLWTHNDSGDNAFIFALDSTGEKLGTWKVSNAKNIDWEDIAEIKKYPEPFTYISPHGIFSFANINNIFI